MMTTATGRDICLKGWEKSGKAIENGINDISFLHPFIEIDPIEDEMMQDKAMTFDGRIDTAYITDGRYLESNADSEW